VKKTTMVVIGIVLLLVTARPVRAQDAPRPDDVIEVTALPFDPAAAVEGVGSTAGSWLSGMTEQITKYLQGLLGSGFNQQSSSTDGLNVAELFGADDAVVSSPKRLTYPSPAVNDEEAD